MLKIPLSISRGMCPQYHTCIASWQRGMRFSVDVAYIRCWVELVFLLAELILVMERGGRLKGRERQLVSCILAYN